MKRIFLGSLLISVLISSSYADNLVEVNILSTSDIHSFISDDNYYSNTKSENYGLISWIGTIEKFRRDHKNTYLVDTGDLYQETQSVIMSLNVIIRMMPIIIFLLLYAA